MPKRAAEDSCSGVESPANESSSDGSTLVAISRTMSVRAAQAVRAVRACGWINRVMPKRAPKCSCSGVESPANESSSDDSSHRMVELRHPFIAEAESDAVISHTLDFAMLSEDALTSIGVGVGQRLVAAMTPCTVLVQPLPANWAAHVDNLRSQFDAYASRMDCLSSSISQLVALENVLLQRLYEMEKNLVNREETAGFVCAGCRMMSDALAHAHLPRGQVKDEEQAADGTTQKREFGNSE
jgi:hypothetical protein